jgi:hypothetical protein
MRIIKPQHWRQLLGGEPLMGTSSTLLPSELNDARRDNDNDNITSKL